MLSFVAAADLHLDRDVLFSCSVYDLSLEQVFYLPQKGFIIEKSVPGVIPNVKSILESFVKRDCEIGEERFDKRDLLRLGPCFASRSG